MIIAAHLAIVKNFWRYNDLRSNLYTNVVKYVKLSIVNFLFLISYEYVQKDPLPMYSTRTSDQVIRFKKTVMIFLEK